MTSARSVDPNFDRVVVGVDGSGGSLRALEWAAVMAGITGAELLAVHGFEFVPMRGTETNELLWARTAADLTGPWTERLRGTRVRYRTIIEDEDPRSLLCRIAVAEHADVIVVGSRGRSQLAGLLLGSVAEYLVHHGEVPVVVIPANAAISSP